MRDDFNEAVKIDTAKRVNYRCSRCRAQTIGPQTGTTKAVNIGVAAHISAAAPGGPRYNPSLTHDQRKHYDNAIWLCQNCAKLIDNDPTEFTEAILRSLKNEAEEATKAELGKPASLLPVATFPMRTTGGHSLPFLLTAYLEEIIKQPPYSHWESKNYIVRNISDSENPLSRLVSSYSRHSQEGRSQRPKSLESILTQDKKIILLGDPGLGKTTTLIHLTWKTAKLAVETGDRTIPIHIELKYYDGEKDLEALLARRIDDTLRARSLALGTDPSEAIRVAKTWLTYPEFKFLLLLDGLNEVPSRFHTTIRGLLRAALNTPHRIIITCRERDYDQSLGDHAAAFTLQELEWEESLIHLRHVMGRTETWLRIKDAAYGDLKLRGLLGNPLTLELFSLVAQRPDSISLLSNRGSLFREFVSEMPRLRKKEGIADSTPSHTAFPVLAALAHEMQKRGQTALKLDDIQYLDISSNRPLESVLAQAKEWRIIKSDGAMDGWLDFTHQLFQEYFAAVYLDSQLRRGINLSNILGPHLLDEHWREVLVMLAGIMTQPSALLKSLTNKEILETDMQASLLALRCLESSNVSADDEARALVGNALMFRLEAGRATHHEDRIEERIEERIEALGKLCFSPAVDPLIAVLEDESEEDYIRSAAAAALGTIGNPKATPSLLDAFLNGDEFLREQAADTLGQIADPSVIEPLLEALEESDGHLRMCAARALGDIGDPRAVLPLISALNDQYYHPYNREVYYASADMASALGKIQDPRAIEPLSTLLPFKEKKWEFADERDQVGTAAIYALGHIGTPRAKRLLTKLLDELEDGDEISRAEVEIALDLASSRRDNPLIDLWDEDPEVRRRAVDALGKTGGLNVLPELERLAQTDDGRTLFGTVADSATRAAQRIRQRYLVDTNG